MFFVGLAFAGGLMLIQQAIRDTSSSRFVIARSWSIGLAGILAMASLGFWFYVSYRGTSSKSDWGSVWGAIGQWVGGIGTILAVIFTVRYARRDAREADERWRKDALDREQEAAEASERWAAEFKAREERELKAEEARARRYARLVLVEIDGAFNGEDWVHWVDITNYGGEPVMLPRLEAFVHPAGGTTRWDGEDPANVGQEDWAPPTWIVPGKSTRISAEPSFDPPLTAEHERPPWVPIITYQDAAGRRWRRAGNAEPELRAEDDPDRPQGPNWYRRVAY
jgi:hypothetical protein